MSMRRLRRMRGSVASVAVWKRLGHCSFLLFKDTYPYDNRC